MVNNIGDLGAKMESEMLKSNCALTKLNLHSEIGDSGAYIISEVLKSNSTLTILNLESDIKDFLKKNGEEWKMMKKMKYLIGNNIVEWGTNMVSEVLKSTGTLRTLYLISDENNEEIEDDLSMFR